MTKTRAFTFRFCCVLGLWIHSVHKEGFHLNENVTLASAERYYWWIGMSASAKWWIRHCIVCRAAKTTRRAPRWSLISLPLPSPPRETVSFDVFGPLPKTKNGNKYILLIVDLISRHAEAHALSAEEKTAKGCAGINSINSKRCYEMGMP